MWGLTTSVLQAVSSWSLAVAGAAGVVAAVACLVSALASAKLAEQVRVRAEAEVAEAHRRAAEAGAGRAAALAEAAAAKTGAAEAARANSALEQAISAERPIETDGDLLARRAQAFAALVRGHASDLALIVGHAPGAHVSGQVMRAALKSAGVSVRWCRLKPEAEPADGSSGFAVYADPARRETAGLLHALRLAGFEAELQPLRPDEPGLPSPALVIAARAKAPTTQALATCNPVVR